MQTSSSQGSQGFHSQGSSIPIEVPQFKEPLTMKQISERAGKNNAMFHKPKKKQYNYAPHLSTNNQDFMIVNDDTASFVHSATNYTHIVYNLTGTLYDQLRGFMKNELDIFKEIYKNFTNNAYNNGYSKSYHIVRNINSIAAMKKSKSSGRYQDFVREILKNVYGNLYEIQPSSPRLELSDIQNMKPEDIEKVRGEDELIAYDLFSEPIMAIVISLQEALDKITDDEINNLFVLCCHNFIHPINWLLSPVAISLSFFHMQLLGMKKPHKDDPYYTKSNLPRVTYLSLTGLFSEIDIDILNAFSDNVQIINVYDENTGGPSSILNQGEYSSEPSFRDTDSTFQKITKLLLVPLKCSKEGGGKPYQPNDLLTLFQDIVIRSIEKFKPSYIVLNCSLIFDKNSQTPFWLDEETFGHIVHLLCQLCDNKVLIYPFKLPQKPPQDSKDNELLLSGIKRYNQKPKLQTRLQFIWDRYFIPYNEIYLRDCFVQAFEALSGLKEASLFNSQHLKHKYGVNPILNKMLYQITRYYKQHPYYSFLYSKAFAPLARATTNYQLKDGINKITGAAFKNSTIKTIPVWSQKAVSLVKLSFNSESENNWEITLDEGSQYLVDYSSNPQSPNIYIFNAKIFQVSNDQTLKFHGKSCHVKVAAELEDLNSSASLNENLKAIPLEDNPEITENLTEAGLCQCGPYIFQVYGTNLATKKDTTSILYHNFEERKSYKIKAKGEGSQNILPRHAITACAFQRNGEYFLYVFGGQMQPNTQFGEGNKIVKPLDIIDIIEIYSTSNPKSGEWNYRKLPKDTELKGNVFIPYNKSFASYQKNKDGRDVIVIMGGELFKQSCFQWTFPVFEFDIDKKTFAPFQVHVTDFKENPQRKTILNNPHKRPVVTVAIADGNKNFVVNQQQKVATFLIPLKEDSLYFLYSYNWESNECEYEQYQIKKEQEKPAQESTIKENPSVKKPTPISQRLSTKIGYFSKEKIEKLILFQLLKILRSQLSLFEKNEELEKVFWDEIKDAVVKSEISAYFHNNDSKDQRPTTLTEKFKIILEDKEFKEIVRAEDHRTQTLLSYLQPVQTAKDQHQSEQSTASEEYGRSSVQVNQSEVFEKPEENAQSSKRNRMFEDFSILLNKMGERINALNLSSSMIQDSRSTADKSNFPSTSLSSKNIMTEAFSRGFQDIDEDLIKESVQKLKLLLDKEEEETLNASNLEDTSRILAPLYTSLLNIIGTDDKIKGMRLLEEINKSIDASLNETRLSNKKNNTPEGDQSLILKDLSRIQEESPKAKPTSPVEEKKVTQTKEVSITESPKKQEVSTRSIEVQTDISECREEEKTTDEVAQFKQGLVTPIPYRVFFNGSKSELIISDPTNPAELIRLRFKVKKPGYYPYEDISFEFSPSSVNICNNIVACYIDNKFKIRYPEIFSQYKNLVLYADIEASIKSYKQDGKNYLVFRKLFLITQNDEIMNRCLMINKDVLGFFGGTVYKLKGKKSSSESRYCSMYLLQKFTAIGQNSNDFRDTEIDDEMEHVKGECLAIKSKEWTFVCAKSNPSCFEVFDQTGGMGDPAKFPKKFEDYFVHANLVNFRGKEEILMIFCKQSEGFEFLLYDVSAKTFETKQITLVPVDSPDNEKFQTVFSGFEQFEVTTNIDQPLENILIHSFRAETPKIITCRIQVN